MCLKQFDFLISLENLLGSAIPPFEKNSDIIAVKDGQPGWALPPLTKKSTWLMEFELLFDLN